MNIDQVEEMLNRISEELPDDFYRNLNGGILLLPQEKINPRSAHGNLYILGEYVVNSSMGRFINIYYGSLEKMYSHASEKELEDALREVLFHEFTHHVESLSGERGLEKKDAEQMKEFAKRGLLK